MFYTAKNKIQEFSVGPNVKILPSDELYNLAADCVWPHLLLVIEYDEIIWTSHGEEQTSFQSVIIGRISEGNFEQITGMKPIKILLK